MPRRTLPVVLAAGLAACGEGRGPLAPAPAPAPVTSPAPTARYRVTFDAVWSASTHPTDIPRTPHFSGLIGATHGDGVRFWEAGALASEGIRAMAERGRKSPLDEEVLAAIAAGGAQHLLSGGDIGLSPGTVMLDFEIAAAHPLVTLVSMVAPSPDWFVGVSGLDLRDGRDWAAERVVALRPWDAGTDSGATFESRDRATVPREPIAPLTAGPLLVGSDAAPLGTFTFRRLP
jgi:hypothetical protein